MSYFLLSFKNHPQNHLNPDGGVLTSLSEIGKQRLQSYLHSLINTQQRTEAQVGYPHVNKEQFSAYFFFLEYYKFLFLINKELNISLR